jgi:hypothetical protein
MIATMELVCCNLARGLITEFSNLRPLVLSLADCGSAVYFGLGGDGSRAGSEPEVYLRGAGLAC